jgi:hypothetical protein
MEAMLKRMEHNLFMQRRCVTKSGTLVALLATLLAEDPAQFASDLLKAFNSTELHKLLLDDLALLETDDNVVCVAELVLLMQFTDVQLIRHVAAWRKVTFTLHTTVDGMPQQTETISSSETTATSSLNVYKEQYAPEFNGYDPPVQYKAFGR